MRANRRRFAEQRHLQNLRVIFSGRLNCRGASPSNRNAAHLPWKSTSSGALFSVDYDESQLDPGLQTQILNAGKAASFTINTIQNSMSPQVWGAYLENIDALVLGEITAEQFCQALAAAAE